MVSLGVGAYLFTIAMAEYIKDILNSINERTKAGDDENKITDISHQLVDFTEIYSMLKELSGTLLWSSVMQRERERESEHSFSFRPLSISSLKVSKLALEKKTKRKLAFSRISTKP